MKVSAYSVDRDDVLVVEVLQEQVLALLPDSFRVVLTDWSPLRAGRVIARNSLMTVSLRMTGTEMKIEVALTKTTARSVYLLKALRMKLMDGLDALYEKDFVHDDKTYALAA